MPFEQDLQQPANSTPMKLSDYLPLYNIYRDYVVREGELINTRLTWILTINGFLYATFGYTLQKEMEVLSHPWVTDAGVPPHLSLLQCLARASPDANVLMQGQIYLFTISVVGVLISLFASRSIRAARQASDNIDDIFKSAPNRAHFLKSLAGDTLHDVADGKSLVCQTADGYLLPYIRGGALKQNIGMGNYASSIIPLILAGGWIISIVALLLVTLENFRVLFGG